MKPATVRASRASTTAISRNNPLFTAINHCGGPYCGPPHIFEYSKMYTTISSRIIYTGVDDMRPHDFEGQYPVPDGITYNSYLIGGDSPVVMDSVDHAFAGQWLDNLEEALAGRRPAAMVCLHLEPDHSGSAALLMERYPDMKLIVSKKAAAMLPNFFAQAAEWKPRVEIVADGESREVAPGVTLQFIYAPMVHWPEVMTAYFAEEKTLFSADAFGTFGSPGRPQADPAPEMARYYCNICGKYGLQVRNLLSRAAALDIARVCSLHGPVLEGRELAEAIRLYSRWAAWEADLDGVMIACASIYGHTLAVAEELQRILTAKGVDCRLIDLTTTDVSYAVAEAFRRRVWVLAASSYDGGVFPPMSGFLHHLQTKGMRNRRVGLIENGSWSPVAARVMKGILDTMPGMETVEPVVRIMTRPTAGTSASLEELAGALAQR